MEIAVGQIYEVVSEGFFTSYDKNNKERPVGLLVGEKIEIRYPNEWHFRTEDNKYFHAKPEIIKKHSKLFGVIFENVRFANTMNLPDILKFRLYCPIK